MAISEITAEQWIAIGTIALAFVTAVLVLVGTIHISAIRQENKKAQTLAACSNWDQNPNIYDASQKLWAGIESGELEATPRKFRPQINVILNFLDAIAIGIEQELYIENLASDHLDAIIKRVVKRYIDPSPGAPGGLVERVDLNREDFLRLIDLRDRWSRAHPRFRDVPRWKFWR
jgi:hypothetical protein